MCIIAFHLEWFHLQPSSKTDGHSSAGVPGVTCYIGDIVVSSADEDSHLQSLGEVFNRLGKHKIYRLKLGKCGFLFKSTEYLGHDVSKDGIQPVPTNIEATVRTIIPANVQQLRSFLGPNNYYWKFMPNLATLLYLLNALLQANKKWKWSSE